jgi:hypothetical protein
VAFLLIYLQASRFWICWHLATHHCLRPSSSFYPRVSTPLYITQFLCFDLYVIAPTPLELTLLSLISTHIPTITLPPYPPSLSSINSFTSIPQASSSTILLGPTNKSTINFARASFRPRNTLELRTGLFRSPATLQGLRHGAVERFEHWREIRQACDQMGFSSFVMAPGSSVTSIAREATIRQKGFDNDLSRRQKLDWELSLSRDVALALNSVNKERAQRNEEPEQDDNLASLEEGTDHKQRVGEDAPDNVKEEVERMKRSFIFPDKGEKHDPFYDHYEILGDPDPLYLPTLFRLSTALLGAFGKRLVSSIIHKSPRHPRPLHHRKSKESAFYSDISDEEEEEGWTLSKWGIAGIAFAIGYCAGRMLTK